MHNNQSDSASDSILPIATAVAVQPRQTEEAGPTPVTQIESVLTKSIGSSGQVAEAQAAAARPAHVLWDLTTSSDKASLARNPSEQPYTPSVLPRKRTGSKLSTQVLIEDLPSIPVSPNKRRASVFDDMSGSEHPQKRTGRPKPRHTLNPLTSSKSPATPTSDSAISPLFYSNTPRRRPALQGAFSSTEAAVSMLKGRDDPGGVTTLKLARGSISNPSPPRSGSLRSSSNRSSTAMSVDFGRVTDVDGTAMQALGSAGVLELLEQDERPTFIVDLADARNDHPGELHLLYKNAALRTHEDLLEAIVGKATDIDSSEPSVDDAHSEFKAWALSFVKNEESLDVCLLSYVFEGLVWNCSLLKKRFRVISGSSGYPKRMSMSTSTSASVSQHGFPSSALTAGKTPTPLSPFVDSETRKHSGSPLKEELEPSDYFGESAALTTSNLRAVTRSSPLVTTSPMDITPDGLLAYYSPDAMDTISKMPTLTPSFDWTRLPISDTLPPHIQFARSIDWSKTSLGPIEDWSPDLRTTANMVMASPHPAAMYWGADYIAIYNEAYVLLAGQKHPKLMGQSYKEAWAEIWPEIEDVFVQAADSGQATMKDDDCLFITRNGFLEESWFSWSIIPIVSGADGSVVGLYNPAFEKSRRKIAERRMFTLREIGERTGTAREVKEFWSQVLKGLEYNEYDAPFVFLYSTMEDNDSDMSSTQSGSVSPAPSLLLEGTLGVPADHPSVLESLDLRLSDQGWAPFLKQAMRNNGPLHVTIEDPALADLLAGLDQRGWGDQCRAAIVCPLHPTTGDSIIGFLIMGVNPRKPYDDDYELYIQLLNRQLANSMASVVLFEEEIRQGQRAAQLAAQDRIELSKQLDLRTQEAIESETRFTRMAEFAPVGMFITDHNGRIVFANDSWYEITRHPRNTNSTDIWMKSIKDEDQASVEDIWRQVTIEKIQVTHEFRMKAPWQSKDSKGDTWVLLNAYPERDESGALKSVFGCLTNISQQKFAEDIQKGRMEEAVEMKRQQENFIDITSHEMRNPLSAILQCADEISSTLSDCIKQLSITPDPALDKALESSVDAAQTITLCAQHQKRIVDDVLTMSKLDSALLLVTPVDIQPIGVVERALKMFESEFDSNDIKMEFKVEDSYNEVGVDWVRADPSRLLQVLINLTTNAIKFTTSQSKRTIVVAIGASRERPTNTHVPGQQLCLQAKENKVSYFPSRTKATDQTNKPEWGTGEEVFIHFAVQDTGRGLDADEKHTLFRRFSQASPRTHVQYGGSGLGLFVCKELTELQGGQIGVYSERDIGSTFAFYVKCRRTDKPEHEMDTVAKVSKKGGKSTLAVHEKQTEPFVQPSKELSLQPSVRTIPPRELKVLIVEDNLVNQRVLQKQLKNLGCTVYVANHGVEALDTLKESVYWASNATESEEAKLDIHVVLMDLEMPVMDGLTCARTIRQLEAEGTIKRHVPIIAVTANAREEQKQGAIEAGMDDVVSKPFRIPDLLPKVNELLQKCDTMNSSSN